MTVEPNRRIELRCDPYEGPLIPDRLANLHRGDRTLSGPAVKIGAAPGDRTPFSSLEDWRVTENTCTTNESQARGRTRASLLHGGYASKTPHAILVGIAGFEPTICCFQGSRGLHTPPYPDDGTA